MKTEMLSVRLPLPPSVNHYWGRGVHGNVYVTSRGTEYRGLVRRAIADKYGGVVVPCRDMVSVSVSVVETTRYHIDVDNIGKCLLDSLAGSGLILDDCQVRELGVVFANEINATGWLDVRISTVQQSEIPSKILSRLAGLLTKALLPKPKKADSKAKPAKLVIKPKRTVKPKQS